MNSQIFSREYLQSFPELQKQEQIDFIISGFIEQLKRNASEGKTEYRINRDAYERGVHRNNLHVGSMIGVNTVARQIQERLTDAELIAGLFTRFPGCRIYYDESYLPQSANTQVLKKEIVIDWS
jgi:hypothetical protein